MARLTVLREDGHRYTLMVMMAEEAHCQHGSSTPTRYLLRQPDARLASIEVVTDTPPKQLPERLAPDARELLIAFSEWASADRQAPLLADDNWTWTGMIDAFIAEATLSAELEEAARRGDSDA